MQLQSDTGTLRRGLCLLLLTLGLAAVISPPVFAQNGTAKIELSDSEQAWLREHPHITVVQDPAWPPVEFVDDKGRASGISNDYLDLIEQRLGIVFTRIESQPWQFSYEKHKRHEIDMTTSVAETPERLGFWTFTKPYMTTPVVIVTRTNVTFISRMSELSHKRVAVVEGYAPFEWLSGDYPDIELVPVKNAKEGLTLLSSKGVFAFIDNMLVTGYYMSKLKLQNLKIAGETPYKNAQCMAVRNDWPEFAAILQKALDSVSDSEKDEIYYRWVPVRYERGFDYALLWQASAFFALVIVMLVGWNRKLRREVMQRKAAEKLSAEAAYRLNKHFTETPMGAIDWDLDFNITGWNPSAERIFGFSKEEAVGQNVRIIVPETFKPRIGGIWTNLTSGSDPSEDARHVINENLTKSGEIITCEWINTPIMSQDGTLLGVASLCRDITPQIKAQEQIRVSLAEKDILLRELYHRTKNNMQVITAFLQLKSRYTQNREVDDLVQSVSSRIQTMSLVHEKLYKSKNLSHINIREYVEELIPLLISCNNVSPQNISIEYGIEDIEFSIDNAIPLGLVINEIVTNAFKHAFPGRQDGHINIQLYRENEETVILKISDNGVGFPENFDIRNSTGFGMMTTISIIEMQMKGRFEVVCDKGVNYTITIRDSHFMERL